MKTIIVYKSNYGHTKRYVDALRTRVLPDEVIEFNKANFHILKNYDTIFYLGPIKNNVIEGLNKVLKHYYKLSDKNFFIAGCGVSCLNVDEYTKGLIITSNALDDKHVRLYLLPGGIDLSLMSPIKRTIFKKALQISASKTDQPGAGVGIENLIRNGVDFVNIDRLDRMVEVYNRIKN